MLILLLIRAQNQDATGFDFNTRQHRTAAVSHGAQYGCGNTEAFEFLKQTWKSNYILEAGVAEIVRVELFCRMYGFFEPRGAGPCSPGRGGFA